jgi:hypothetical protein
VIRSSALGVALGLAGALPAAAATGGPDGYGYVWADSYEPGVTYNYELGTTATTLGDDDSFTASIGFDFDFYGQTFSAVTVTSNGMMHFGAAGYVSYTNQHMPYGSYRIVAPLWDDLNPSAGGSIYTGTSGSYPNRVFIAEWWGVPRYNDIDAAYFEIKLMESDGAIEFHYLDVDFDDATYDWGASATVGIGDGTQGYGLERSYNSGVLADSYAIRFEPHPCWDDDGDGHDDDSCGGDDCDDGDADVYPGAAEICDGVQDNDCAGNVDSDEVDNDGDGFSECDDDCNDGQANVYPGAVEVCDGVADNDCNGMDDPDEVDNDGDGFSECDDDCDDAHDTVYPGAPEVCDGALDNNCDGAHAADETDDDGDGYSECADDCDDADDEVHPGAEEICDGNPDNDCDGTEDPDDVDDDGDGLAECDGDCDDGDPTIHGGATEACHDGVDNDCDGAIDAADVDCGGQSGDDDTDDDDDDDDGDDDTTDPPGPPGGQDDGGQSLGIACDCRLGEGRGAGPPLVLGLLLAVITRSWVRSRRSGPDRHRR